MRCTPFLGTSNARINPPVSLLLILKVCPFPHSVGGGADGWGTCLALSFRHLLDMISEVYPEVDDDLSSSDESSQSGNEGGGVNSHSIASTSSGRLGGRGDIRQFEEIGDLGADDLPLGRRYRKRDLSLIDPLPRVTKRRRRQGKRDDRNDPKPIEPLRHDKDGNLIFPIVVGRGQDEVRIHDLGKVKWEPETYHTSRYIWTVGFKSTRVYPSMKDMSSKCVYTSEILDGGEMPVFQVTASDMADSPFRASSSSGVWKQILDILMAKGVGVKTHASGPQMYGLSHLGVTKAIQELENADRCSKYIMQKWIDPGKQPFIKGHEYQEDEAADGQLNTSPAVAPSAVSDSHFVDDGDDLDSST
ncbi:hypothetical protein GQ54DRAFT_296056 [Martensiomyces pterosporus]|nr:hypothetical protein GQ54DRAFT_296056 [Martensiomyces pterosporus]